MLNIDKNNCLTYINIFEKIYLLLANSNVNSKDNLLNNVTTVSKILIQLEKVFKNNQNFVKLFNSTYELLEFTVNNSTSNLDIEKKRKLTLKYLSNFELELLSQFPIQVYITEHSKLKTKLNSSNAIIEISKNDDLQLKLFQNRDSETLNIIIKNDYIIGDLNNFDIVINEKDTLDTFNNSKTELNLNDIDYYLYDRLYLEAKLESLISRKDIQLLLAGSSYTMCGLFEKQMPIPSRNVAVDAQDLYYSLKTIRKALDYNPNIKYCVLSFAYYLWGYDLSRSTSEYQLKRVTDVNYPVFLDAHNFPFEMEKYKNYYYDIKPLKNIGPLYRKLFDYDELVQDIFKKIKLQLTDAHYFNYPRIKNIISEYSEEENHINAQYRTDSHNKFFKYKETVKENVKLFEEFLNEIEEKDVQLIVYVPPVSSYYRKYIKKELINDYYEIMNPFIEKYNFKFIDLFDSDLFTDEDFYDYDHLNDYGAEKLGEVIISIINDMKQ